MKILKEIKTIEIDKNKKNGDYDNDSDLIDELPKLKKQMVMYSGFIFNKLLNDKKIKELIAYISSIYIPDNTNNDTLEQSIIISIIKGTDHYSSDELSELFNELMKKNINLNKSHNSQTFLMKTIMNDNIILFRILLNYTKKISTNINDNFPLHFAIYNHKIDFVKELLLNGCDYNLKDDDGFTPVAIATLVNDLKMITFLCENYHVDINIKNNKHRSPIFIACNNLSKNNTEENILDIIEFLIKNGSNVNDRDNKNTSPLMTLVNNLNEFTQHCIITLINAGANPNLSDIDGNTVLLRLLLQNDNNDTRDIELEYYLISCMMTLINYGAYPNHVNKFGQGIMDLMSKQTLKYYQLCSSLNNNTLKKGNDKIFVAHECSICLEKKQIMIFLNSCQHIVTCKDCFDTLQTYYQNENEYENEVKVYKCSFCNVESLTFKIVQYMEHSEV